MTRSSLCPNLPDMCKAQALGTLVGALCSAGVYYWVMQMAYGCCTPADNSGERAVGHQFPVILLSSCRDQVSLLAPIRGAVCSAAIYCRVMQMAHGCCTPADTSGELRGGGGQVSVPYTSCHPFGIKCRSLNLYFFLWYPPNMLRSGTCSADQTYPFPLLPFSLLTPDTLFSRQTRASVRRGARSGWTVTCMPTSARRAPTPSRRSSVSPVPRLEQTMFERSISCFEPLLLKSHPPSTRF
jgi:hypothetical protein